MTQTSFHLSVDSDKVRHAVSDTLFGLFIEDLNFTCDGGLNANKVVNHSFDAVYMDAKNSAVWAMICGLHGRIGLKPDRLRNWSVSGGALESLHDAPVSENSWYARAQADGACRLSNLGYNGFKKHAGKCAMSIVEGGEYEFSCYLRNRGFEGRISVRVEATDGSFLTEEKPFTSVGPDWSLVTMKMLGRRTDYGKLVLVFDGKGAIDIDCVILMDADTWGRGEAKWSQGRLRKDLVEMLRDLKPTFLRFPGGSLVEGAQVGLEYRWKDTVGPIVDRRNTVNFWGSYMPGGEYQQSFQVGFYEYFLLCEDLRMKPVPVVWAGIALQQGLKNRIPMDGAAFQEQVVQPALDLLEFANGDPATSRWARIRADAGHPEPFGMKHLGIGNENPGEDYLRRFELIAKAVREKDPEIVCIMSSGLLPAGKAVDSAWKLAREKYPDALVDEHFYGKPDKAIRRANRYDGYPRNTARVFLGEYAAASSLAPTYKVVNTYGSALAEAAFLTGLERNSDVVAMSCYAPLFTLVGSDQWKHNLIQFSPSRVLTSTNYFVQRMYGTTVGDHVVEMAGTLPDGVFASATTTPARLALKLVNTTETAMEAVLDLPGVRDGSAGITLLQCDDLQTKNTLEYQGEPEILVHPRESEVDVRNGKTMFTLEKQSFYVLTVERAMMQGA